MRGFLAGAIIGAVISGLGVTAASYLSPSVVSLAPPEPPQTDMPDSAGMGQGEADAAPDMPEAETPPAESDVPEVDEPDMAPPPAPDTDPAETPETDTDPATRPDVPETPESADVTLSEGDDAVTPMPEATPPEVDEPDIAASPAPDTAPAEAPETDTDPATRPDAPETPESANVTLSEGNDAVTPTPETTPPAEPEGDSPPAVPAPETPVEAPPEIAAPESTAPESDAAPEAPAPERPATTAASDTPDLPAPDAEAETASVEPESPPAAPMPEPEPEAEIAEPDTPPASPTQPDEDESDAPAIAASDPPVAPTPPQGGDEGPGIGVPVTSIGDRAPDVETGRLPSIGDDTAANAAPEEETVTADGPALTTFATPFDAVPGNPLMSVILLDPGPSRPDPAQLDGFPVPLTIGIDPTLPGAAEAMRAYRAAGQEVAVLAPLPEGAAPADVEVAFQSFLDAVPQAVAVLDTPAARLQENRPRAAQVVSILSETGHGLITYERGLNSGLQVADSQGVPAAAVFREFDDGQTQVSAMKRLLDVGAFRAAQEGGVLMVGELRPETITALTEWVLGTRAATVTLAPASALLRAAP